MFFSVLCKEKNRRPLTHLTLLVFIQRMTRTWRPEKQDEGAQLFTADLAVFFLFPCSRRQLQAFNFLQLLLKKKKEMKSVGKYEAPQKKGQPIRGARLAASLFIFWQPSLGQGPRGVCVLFAFMMNFLHILRRPNIFSGTSCPGKASENEQLMRVKILGCRSVCC